MDTPRETSPLTEPPPAARFEVTQQVEAELPRELLRDVASNLKSLARILPYAEYAAIVHRIAEVRWRCTGQR
jgi:hypothetical protein